MISIILTRGEGQGGGGAILAWPQRETKNTSMRMSMEVKDQYYGCVPRCFEATGPSETMGLALMALQRRRSLNFEFIRTAISLYFSKK